jgi:hypothetical protein
VWVELSLYAGVVGGAGYDYLAYTSYIRDKRWGNAELKTHEPDFTAKNPKPDAPVEPTRNSAADDQILRKWLRAPLIDCTLSFLIVLIFSAVFVASGKLVLGPARQIPGDGAFLEYQAQFITRIHPWLYPLYAAAAFLTIAGTLYGTLEVAPTILRETALAVAPNMLIRGSWQRLRKVAIAWCTAVALVVLAISFVYQAQMGEQKLPGLTTILIPVNLFTGSFACGLICLLNPWVDRRLPVQHRLPFGLVALNVIGGIAFVLVALRGYWDFAGWWALAILILILALGALASWVANRLQIWH